VDVQDQLNQLKAMLRDAKAMPMSASCLVNRADTLKAIERLRDALPADLNQADALLSDRDAVLAAGRENAERLLEGARAEREQLIEQTEVLVAARAHAASLTTQARAEAARLLTDADDYVDRKLAEFEVVLGQLGLQVNNGRARLAARRTAELARVKATAEVSPTDKAARDDRDVEVVVAAEVPPLSAPLSPT
jgi:cell division septum initiation protein DivIVA